jgi:hypothetical protein
MTTSPEKQAEELAERALSVRHSPLEILEWAEDRRLTEEGMRGPTTNTVGSGMTLGAIETLDALLAFLKGDDDA